MTAYDPKMANDFRDGRASLMSDTVRALSFEQLETQYDGAAHTLWTAMRPRARPSFNPDLLSDFERWQDGIVQAVDSGTLPIRYLVLGSRFPGVFSLGGDLDLFAQAIRDRNHDALARYGHRCVRILYRNMRGLERPIITIGLVEGTRWGRVRGASVLPRRHCRTGHQLRPARNDVRPVPGHGGALLPVAAAGRGEGRADDPERPDL
ncbi:hypothetical protein GCM10020258_38590 [Sphingomonas yabuuchiae]